MIDKLRSVTLCAGVIILPFSVFGGTTADTAQEAHKAYLAAINSNDLAQFLSTVTDDVIFMAPNSPAMQGKSEVGPWVRGYFEAVETSWQKTTLEFVVKGDWAYERYAYKVTDTPRAGGDAYSDTGNGVNIYRRGKDGVWRVARDIWATDQPLPTN